MEQPRKSHRSGFLMVVFITLLLGIVVSSVSLPYDESLVDESLASLEGPFSIDVLMVQDGGTLVVTVTDSRGEEGYFVFPAKFGERPRYDRLFVGAPHHEMCGSVEVSAPLHTKRKLVAMLKQHAGECWYIDVALAELRGTPNDWLRVAINHLEERWK